MISKVLPFLSKLIPSGLAFKGLNKVNPRIGKYLAGATAAGYGAEEALDYLRNQFGVETQEGLRPDEQAAEARVRQTGQLPKAVGKAAQIGAGVAGIGAVGQALPQVIGSLFGGQEGQSEQQPKNPIAKYSPELLDFIEQHIQAGRSPLEAGALARVPGNKFEQVISKMEKDLGMKFSEILAKIYGGEKQQPQKSQEQQAQSQPKSNVDDALLAALDKILKM